jgi:putative tryptophan/tyrosine transport system substrate-binding protein
MKRRQFIALVGGAVTTWPFVARAQQREQVRRIGILNAAAESDPQQQSWDTAFRQRLNELGWVDGRNIHVDYRWGAGSLDRIQLFAKELVALNPDVLVGVTTPATAALQRETKTIPIIFTVVSDPVGSGFVASLSNPGGNITGFINIEGSLAGKWVELMHEVAPSVSHIGIMYNPSTAPYAKYYVDEFRTAASALSIAPVEAPVHSAAEAEAFMTKLSGEAGAGLVVIPDISIVVYRQTIIVLAERFHLPTIYPFGFYVSEGGLMSYGIEVADLFRGAATYIDRVLKGAKPSELAVQLPTKFELVVNLKTAKTLGIKFPQTVIARADDVIE